VVGFMYDLLLSSNAFFARILAKEKAETFARLSVVEVGLTSFGGTATFSIVSVSIGVCSIIALSFWLIVPLFFSETSVFAVETSKIEYPPFLK
jgi:hypothetical protein